MVLILQRLCTLLLFFGPLANILVKYLDLKYFVDAMS